MSKGLAAALLVCALAGLGLYLFLRQPKVGGAPPQNPKVEGASPSVAPAQPPIRSNPVALAPSLTPAAASPQTQPAQPASDVAPARPVTGPLLFGGPDSSPVNLPGETVLENVRTAIRNYGAMFDGNPVGTNPEIAAALNGGNPKGVNFLEAEKGMRLNARGELVDPWGTPFFFHQLSGTETEIRSAGPDKQMWTADDLLIK